MGKNLSKRVDDPDAERPGLDFLRALAGYPHRSVELSRHQVRSHIVEIHRDPLGRVIGSTERIEQSEFTDLYGQWLD